MASGPCRASMRRRDSATNVMASSQETRSPAITLAHHGLGDTIVGVDEVERVSPLDAQVSLAHRSVEHRPDVDDPSLARTHAQLTAGSAIAAGRSRPGRGQPARQERLVFEGASRAGVDARAAAHARAFEQGGIRVGSNLVSAPRFQTRHTNWPCTSSQMRTQRKQSMHCEKSTRRCGCESSAE